MIKKVIITGTIFLEADWFVGVQLIVNFVLMK